MGETVTFKPQSTPAATGKSLDEVERSHILPIPAECGGNPSRAADVLDIDRVTLHHKLKRYGGTISHSLLDNLRAELSESLPANVGFIP